MTVNCDNLLGCDIKELYEDIGVAFTMIIGGNVEIPGGYMQYNLNRQVTKPFIREFFLEAFLPYDTTVAAGEVLRFDVTSDTYMVMNKTPQTFENEIIQYHAVLYKCNVSGELQRVSGETWDANYQMNPAWLPVRTNAYGLMTEALYGHDLETDEELGQLGLENHELYLPKEVGMRLLDRYIPYSGEFPYKIETLKTRRFPSVYVAELAKDTR